MNELPNLSVPSPILSLCVSTSDLWAGGVGGVARYDHQRAAWQPCKTGLPITRIAALLHGDGWLLAGGPEGIARSTDNGAHWQAAAIDGEFTPITCFCASPTASVVLAGTLSGLLRSTDNGLTWNAIADLQEVEIATLRWNVHSVLAATNDGISRSADAGSTWQATEGTAGQAILAITTLSDERLIALPESGGALVSADSGLTWQASALSLPDGVEGAALHGTASGALLLGTSEGELYRSSDQGQTWTLVSDVFVFAFAEAADHLWAGTTIGVLTSTDAGLTWQPLPLPPIHDLNRLVITPDRVFVAGEFTGLAQLDAASQHWALIAETPVPLALFHAEPTGRLFASGPDGLAISDDGGANWQIVMRGFLGHVSHLVLNNGFGQAATITGRYLLRSLDGGQVWQGAVSPFGTQSVIGLEIGATRTLIVNYDPTSRMAQVCWSTDQGESWECGEELQVQAARAATYPDPLLIGLDDRVLRPREDGGWQMTQLDTGSATEPLAIRKFVGSATRIVALTTHELFTSADGGQTWQPLATDGLTSDQLLDIAMLDSQLYVLTSDSVKIIPLA